MPRGFGRPTVPFFTICRRGSIHRDGKVVDRVDSYFGMRKIAVGRDEKGVTRLLLNGKPSSRSARSTRASGPTGCTRRRPMRL